MEVEQRRQASHDAGEREGSPAREAGRDRRPQGHPEDGQQKEGQAEPERAEPGIEPDKTANEAST